MNLVVVVGGGMATVTPRRGIRSLAGPRVGQREDSQVCRAGWTGGERIFWAFSDQVPCSAGYHWLLAPGSWLQVSYHLPALCPSLHPTPYTTPHPTFWAQQMTQLSWELLGAEASGGVG